MAAAGWRTVLTRSPSELESATPWPKNGGSEESTVCTVAAKVVTSAGVVDMI